MNDALLTAVPAFVWTVILPEWTWLGTMATMKFAEVTVNLALTPPILSQVAPRRLTPLIVTFVPTFPTAGENLVMRGFPAQWDPKLGIHVT